MIDGQGMKLIEPLRELFKDEVRALGRELGIPHELVMRHPFPGPGLAIRVLGEVTPERVEIAQKADNIFISMIREAGLYDKVSQAYAALDPTKAVGVMVSQAHSHTAKIIPLTKSNQGDKRVYAEIIILRAVETTDCKPCPCSPFRIHSLLTGRPVMTASAFPFDNAFLSKCSTRIINEVHGGMFSLSPAGRFIPSERILIPF